MCVCVCMYIYIHNTHFEALGFPHSTHQCMHSSQGLPAKAWTCAVAIQCSMRSCTATARTCGSCCGSSLKLQLGRKRKR